LKATVFYLLMLSSKWAASL